MEKSILLASFLPLLLFLLPDCVLGDDPYRFFTWNVTYGDIWPMGVKQQVCLTLLLFPSCFFMFFFGSSKSLVFSRLLEQRRGFWSMASSQDHRSRPSPMTTLSSTSSIACRSPSSSPGHYCFLISPDLFVLFIYALCLFLPFTFILYSIFLFMLALWSYPLIPSTYLGKINS